MDRVLLLVPSASYRASDFLDAARALELQVIIGCNEALLLTGASGSLQICLDDPDSAAEAIVALDGVTPLDAVLAVDDQGTLAAARASKRLGLRGNPPDAVAAARDKLRMRTLLSAAEISQPAFAALSPTAEDAELTRLAALVGLPCVVKPTSLSASQGVIRADTVAEALAAVGRARSIAVKAGASPDQPLLVEEFVHGPEVAVEGVLTNGELSVLAVFDKPDPLDGPFFEETLYVTPSRLGATELRAVTTTTQAATRALNLREGPVHAELRVRGGRAWVIEVAARSIGGLCSRTLEFGTGMSLEYLILAHALGRPVDSLQRAHAAAGVLMLPIGAGGILAEVAGRERALAVPGIVGIELTIAPGRMLVPLPEGNRYLGFVFARGDRPEHVEAALRAALAELDVRLERGRPVRQRAAGR
ncbi:MAG: ATP-grasp domain-containing protein [Acidimicrobiales bacterium]